LQILELVSGGKEWIFAGANTLENHDEDRKAFKGFDGMIKGNYKLIRLCADTKYEVCVATLNKEANESKKSEAITVKMDFVSKFINVMDYGAVADVRIVNGSECWMDDVDGMLTTAQLQKAIDECPEFGVVVVPPGNYLTGALFIKKSNITIELQKGARLVRYVRMEPTV